MRKGILLAAFAAGVVVGFLAPGELLAQGRTVATHVLDTYLLLYLDGEAFRLLCFG